MDNPDATRRPTKARRSSDYNTNNFLFVYETTITPALDRGSRQEIQAHVRRQVAKQFRLTHKGVRKEGTGQLQHPLLAPRKPTSSDPGDAAFGSRSIEASVPHQAKTSTEYFDGVGERSRSFTQRSGVGASRSNLSRVSGLGDTLGPSGKAKVPYCHCLPCKSSAAAAATQRNASVDIATLARKVQSHTSPLEVIGAGRVDPFLSYPDQKPTRFLHEMIDHMITYLGPGLMLDGSKISNNDVAKIWLNIGRKHPLVFHAMVFTGSIHVEFLRTSKISPRSMKALSPKLAIIQELKKVVENVRESYIDGAILGMLTLSFGEAVDSSQEMASPFASPLQNAQWINVYGSLKTVPEHMMAIRNLLKLKGGLENLQLPGLAEIIVRGDIIAATRSLSKPALPPMQASEGWVAGIVEWAISQQLFRLPLRTKFLLYQDYGLDSTLLSMIVPITAVTFATDHYIQGIRNSPSLGIICKARSTVQKRILSLPPAEQGQARSLLKPDVYEACRLALIIYGVAVIFPVPHSYNVFQGLVTRLKTTIEAEGFGHDKIAASELFLWMLVLGGIAASNKAEREWFVLRLVSFVERSGVRDWESVEQIMGSFLWLKSACNPGGKQVWSEVMIRHTQIV